jgi:signal transduction histidine kinase
LSPTIYEVLRDREFVEELHQTSTKEFWYRFVAVVWQFSSGERLKGLLFTHNPYVLLDRQSEDLQTWVFTTSDASILPAASLPIAHAQIVKLAKDDPLKTEWLCLLLTEALSVLAVASERSQSCLITMHPEPIEAAIAVLKQRLTHSEQMALCDAQLQQFPPKLPPYQVMSRFGALLLAQSVNQELPIPEIQEVDVIKAITHEVRTPLTTIRTLVRSLMRRKDVTTGIKQRLEQINSECTEQIERFNLIFEAAELEAYPISLEATFIQEMLEGQISRWQEQAIRRQITLEANLPSHIPAILSNAKLLQQVLNGLVDRLIRSFPPKSHIQMQVTVAGEHLKFQFLSLPENAEDRLQTRQNSPFLSNLLSPLLKAVGQWLMLQPETGTLSLSLPITKTILQALGGKLTVKLHPTSASYDGEVLTIFLPIYQAE